LLHSIVLWISFDVVDSCKILNIVEYTYTRYFYNIHCLNVVLVVTFNWVYSRLGY
jgi:hypothetical protein